MDYFIILLIICLAIRQEYLHKQLIEACVRDFVVNTAPEIPKVSKVDVFDMDDEGMVGLEISERRLERAKKAEEFSV